MNNQRLAEQLLGLCIDWQGRPIVDEATKRVLHEAAAALNERPQSLPDGCCGYTDADGTCCTPMPRVES